MMMINLEDLIGKFKAQRCFILGLNKAEKLTDEQRHFLREISRINHEIADMIGLQVPSMRELTQQATEVQMLEHLYQLEAPNGSEETAEASKTE